MKSTLAIAMLGAFFVFFFKKCTRQRCHWRHTVLTRGQHRSHGTQQAARHRQAEGLQAESAHLDTFLLHSHSVCSRSFGARTSLACVGQSHRLLQLFCHPHQFKHFTCGDGPLSLQLCQVFSHCVQSGNQCS